MSTTKHDPQAVEDYLADLPQSDREALQDLCRIVRDHVPEVRERISYGTTIIFALQRDLVGCVAQKDHLSFFTMSPPLAEAMKDEITATHRVSGATIHFTPDHPLPESLVRSVLDGRVAEEAAR